VIRLPFDELFHPHEFFSLLEPWMDWTKVHLKSMLSHHFTRFATKNEMKSYLYKNENPIENTNQLFQTTDTTT